MIQDFKQFLLRGNVVDLAVAFVIGAAFKSIVDAFVADLVTPLIGAIGGKPDFSALDFTINDSRFLYGDFINQIISFLIIAAVIFFFVVKPINLLMSRARREPTADPASMKCPFCYSEIAIQSTRCAFCTSEVTPGNPAAAAT